MTGNTANTGSAADGDDSEQHKPNEGDAVYRELLQRTGEGAPQPRLAPTRRLMDLLGDPQRLYPVIHITGTNGKTSTSRIIDSILRAHGLRIGLFTSPHLVRFNERIVIDGEPISDEALARNWEDIRPYVQMVDTELKASDEPALTFFEILSALAYACLADAPVDVAVIEVGMGGEWDSTNVADGQVAVFTPISLDHTARLGSSVEEIARTKSGIIKPLASIVSAHQQPGALAELQRAAELTESSMATEPDAFGVEESVVAVGGQLVTIQGIAGRYEKLFLPLNGAHQAQNAAVAIAAVESFLGSGSQPLALDVLTQGLANASSPGRLQVVGTKPTVLVDAAHNPAGAASLAEALSSYYAFDSITCVFGILADKDVEAVVRSLEGSVTRFVVTSAPSDRAVSAQELGKIVAAIVGDDRLDVVADVAEACDRARQLAAETSSGAALVTGSITLVGSAIALAMKNDWMNS